MTRLIPIFLTLAAACSSSSPPMADAGAPVGDGGGCYDIEGNLVPCVAGVCESGGELVELGEACAMLYNADSAPRMSYCEDGAEPIDTWTCPLDEPRSRDWLNTCSEALGHVDSCAELDVVWAACLACEGP